MYSVLLTRSVYQGTSMLFRSELKKAIIPIPEFVEYHDAWISSCAACHNGITYTFEPITNYRLHGNNISIQTHQKRTIIRSILSYLNKKHNSQNFRILYLNEIENRCREEWDLSKNERFSEIKTFLGNFNIGKNYKMISNFFDTHYESMYYCNDRKKFTLRKLKMFADYIKNKLLKEKLCLYE